MFYHRYCPLFIYRYRKLNHPHAHTHTHTHTHTYIYIYIYKHVWLKTTDFFSFQNLQIKTTEYFLMSGSRWCKKYPILAQALSTISLIILRGCVGLFVAVSFIFIHLECIFGFFYRWGWYILLGWVVGFVIEYV